MSRDISPGDDDFGLWAPDALYVSNRGVIACPQHGGEYLRAAVAASPGRFNYLTPLDHWQKLPRDAVRLYDARCKECENR